MTEVQIRQIQRLRWQGATWDQIAERTGLPKSSAYAAIQGRKDSQRTVMRRYRMKRLREQVRMLRARVKYLESLVNA